MGNNSVIVGWYLHVDKFGNVPVSDVWETLIVLKEAFIQPAKPAGPKG